MTFPVIREILCTLAEFDLFAALALTETSATFHDFIFGQVVTAKVVCDFLRQNQYTLRHDIYESLFSNRQISLLHRALEVFRKRKEVSYQDSIPFLAALLARTPLQALLSSPSTSSNI